MLEAAGEDYLENITPHAVGYSLADVGFVLLVRQRRGRFAYGTEVVNGIIAVVNGFPYFVQLAFLAGSQHFQQQHLVLEVVENDEILV